MTNNIMTTIDNNSIKYNLNNTNIVTIITKPIIVNIVEDINSVKHLLNKVIFETIIFNKTNKKIKSGYTFNLNLIQVNENFNICDNSFEELCKKLLLDDYTIKNLVFKCETFICPQL